MRFSTRMISWKSKPTAREEKLIQLWKEKQEKTLASTSGDDMSLQVNVEEKELVIQEDIGMSAPSSDNKIPDHIYLVAEHGVTQFVISDSSNPSKKFKVSIGSPHSCNCQEFSSGLCHHLLFIYLKIFHLPIDSALVFQPCWTESEIDDVITKRFLKKEEEKRKRAQKKQLSNEGSATSNHDAEAKESLNEAEIEGGISPTEVKRRVIEEDDVCAICQDELLSMPQLANAKALAFCRFGCGGAVHIRCMRIWAEHQISTSKPSVTCPMCRSDWIAVSNVKCATDNSSQMNQLLNTLKLQEKEFHDSPTEFQQSLMFASPSSKSSAHSTSNCATISYRCKHCKLCISPQRMELYRCMHCIDHNACRGCYLQFLVKQRNRTAPSATTHFFLLCEPKSLSWTLPPAWSSMNSSRQAKRKQYEALLSSLSSREITQNDYELLVQLDTSSSVSASVTLYSNLATSLPQYQSSVVEDSTSLCCPLCSSKLDSQTRSCRIYPHCNHIVHEECLCSYLMYDLNAKCSECDRHIFPGLSFPPSVPMVDTMSEPRIVEPKPKTKQIVPAAPSLLVGLVKDSFICTGISMLPATATVPAPLRSSLDRRRGRKYTSTPLTEVIKEGKSHLHSCGTNVSLFPSHFSPSSRISSSLPSTPTDKSIYPNTMNCSLPSRLHTCKNMGLRKGRLLQGHLVALSAPSSHPNNSLDENSFSKQPITRSLSINGTMFL